MRFAQIIAGPALLLSLALAPTAQAETREERLAVATEYNDAAVADMDMEAMIRTMWEPLVAQINPTATDDQKDQVHALYMQSYEPKLKELMGQQPEVMADIFTLKELQDLRDFYATESGRAAVQKLPQVMQAIQPQIMTMVQETLPTVIPQLQQILTPQQ